MVAPVLSAEPDHVDLANLEGEVPPEPNAIPFSTSRSKRRSTGRRRRSASRAIFYYVSCLGLLWDLESP